MKNGTNKQKITIAQKYKRTQTLTHSYSIHIQ